MKRPGMCNIYMTFTKVNDHSPIPESIKHEYMVYLPLMNFLLQNCTNVVILIAKTFPEIKK